MECTLATLIACFSWSGLYVETGLQAQDHHPTRSYTEMTKLYVGQDFQPTGVNSYDVKLGGNPYGRFGLGYAIDVGRFTWSLEAMHVSSLVTGKDVGVNSVSLNVRWRPFR
jgi:hypothetical protein